MPETNSGQFERELICCAEELGAAIDRLLSRYSPVVVVGALAVQISTNVHTLVERGICTPESARDVFRRLEVDLLG